MSRQFTINAALAIAAVAATVPATAAPRSFRPAFMPVGAAADAPAGFIDMCRRDVELCLAGNAASTAPRAPALRFADSPTAPVAHDRVPAPMPVALLTTAFDVPAEARWASVFGAAATSKPSTAQGLSVPIASSPASEPYAPTLSEAGGFGTSALASRRQANGNQLLAMPRGAVRDEVRLIRHINSQINRAVEQVSDLALTGQEEYWERPDPLRPAGDCEDIAIEKRMRLLAAGFPASRMFFAVAFRTGVGLHTVLIARMHDADYVLDSLSPHVLRWTKARYSWLRLQSPTDPLVWTRFGAPAPMPLS